MYYYKIMEDGYVKSIGTMTTVPSNPIDEAEYNELIEFIEAMPTVDEGKRVQIAQTETGYEYITVDIPDDELIAMMEAELIGE